MCLTLAPGDRVGSWALERYIHRGTFGSVWVGRNVEVGGYRAVKVVRDDGTGLGAVELAGVASYKQLADHHHGLMTIDEFGRMPCGCFFYTMPLADDARGGAVIRDPNEYDPVTLEGYLNRHRPLPVDRVLGVANPLLAALRTLHDAGYVHRDVKPANVVLVGGRWRLCDVGLLARRDQIVTNGGTRWYTPPEGNRDRRADLFAIGRVLFRLATDHDPAEFDTFCRGALTIPGGDERNTRLQEIIQKACDTDPRRRYQTAAEMAADLAPLRRQTEVTVILDQDFGSFGSEHLDEFIAALRAKGFNVFGTPKFAKGSVRVTFELPADEVELLEEAVRAGEFASFRTTGAVEVAPLDASRKLPSIVAEDEVGGLLFELASRSDRELASDVWPHVEVRFAPVGALAATSPLDALTDWAKLELPRLCRGAGDAGKLVLEYIRDPATSRRADRVTIIAELVAASFSEKPIDPPALFSLAVLAARLNAKPKA